MQTRTLITFLCICEVVRCQLQAEYHSNEELFEYLTNYQTRFPDIAATYSIGETVQGLKLLVVKVSTTKDDLAPNVKLIGNIHGNEPVGREILLHFLEYIGTNYAANETIQHLLNTTTLHILPALNPDGFTIGNRGQCDGMKGRHNANDFDLNRNFPDYYRPSIANVEQPETSAIKHLMDKTTFSLSASLHSGALVANYPFDSAKEFSSASENVASLAPDDDILQHLAVVYSNAHTIMHNGDACEQNFPNGITNGAKWYSFPGGMQDYNYAFRGTMELTLELSCCKYPLDNEIENLWLDNKEALIQFSSQANIGLRGKFLDYLTFLEAKDISLKIAKRHILFYPDKKGRFWRILLPGRYILQVLLKGKIHKSVRFVVNKSSTATTIHLNLTINENERKTTMNLQTSTSLTPLTTMEQSLSNLERSSASTCDYNTLIILTVLCVFICYSFSTNY